MADGSEYRMLSLAMNWAFKGGMLMAFVLALSPAAQVEAQVGKPDAYRAGECTRPLSNLYFRMLCYGRCFASTSSLHSRRKQHVQCPIAMRHYQWTVCMRQRNLQSVGEQQRLSEFIWFVRSIIFCAHGVIITNVHVYPIVCCCTDDNMARCCMLSIFCMYHDCVTHCIVCCDVQFLM